MARKSKTAAARRPEHELHSASRTAGAATPGQVPGNAVSRVFGYLLLSPALLPLFFIPPFVFPFSAPKTIGFRSLGVVLLAALVWLVLARVPLHYQRLKSRVTWIPAALLVVAYLTSLLGVNFYHSFWSSFERGDGLLTLSTQVLFFYAILLHADAQFLRRLAAVNMWVSAVIALYALVQWSNVALQMPIPIFMKSTDRIGATFGNAAFMASYLGMSLFLTLWFARDSGRWMRWLCYVIVATQGPAILVSGTRGTILALTVAGIIATAWLSWRGSSRMQLIARCVLAGCVVMIGLFLAFRPQLAKLPFAPIQRVAAISTSSGTGAVRLELWRSIGREALRHPLTGVGAEHVEYAYNKVYTPELISGQFNDHSHNVYLDYFVQFGAMGLLLYLALVVVALNRARRMSSAGIPAGGYLFLLFVTYAVQNFFVFDIPATLWLFMAVVASALADPRSVAQAPDIPRLNIAVPSVLAPAILLLLVPVSVQPVRANLLLAQVIVRLPGDPEEEARVVARGLSLRTYADLEYGYNIYNTFTGQQQRLSGGSLATAHRVAQGVLAGNLARYPYDVRTGIYLAYVIDHTPPELVSDAALLNQASEALIKVSPHRSAAWFYRANVELRQADSAVDTARRNAHFMKALGILKQYSDLEPRSSTPRYAIANIHLAMGDVAQARIWADRADAIYQWDADAARAAAGYYISAGDWMKARRFLNEVAGNDMTDYAVLLDLAHASYLVGDVNGARGLVEHLRKVSPATLAADPELLAALEQK